MEAIGIWGATSKTGSGIGGKILDWFVKEKKFSVFAFGRNQEKIALLLNTTPCLAGGFCWDLQENGAEKYQNFLFTNKIRTIISTIGFGLPNPFPFLSCNELRQMTEANIVSPFLVLKNSIFPIARLGGGRIVSFGSIVSFAPREGSSGYSASKMGFRGLLEAARRELKIECSNVSIHGVYTGNIKRIGIENVIRSVVCLSELNCGLHCDVIMD